MFKHILLPLDGSKLAESAIPAAASLSEKTGAPIILLHIIEKDTSGEIHREHHLTEPAEAEAYLNELASKFQIQAETHVHTTAVADVARSIVWHATREFQPDLIILCSHGKGGMRDLFFGSIAQQVAAAGATPVLLLRPEEGKPFQLSRILVPLDNESIHDESLPLTEALAKAYDAELDLLCVIPTPSTLSGGQGAASGMLPGTARAYLELAEENAHEHLQAHIEAAEKDGIRASYDILRGDPAQVIAKTAEKNAVDLIVFGTHGKTGLDAFWSRSVTANVTRRTSTPLLLIPLPE